MRIVLTSTTRKLPRSSGGAKVGRLWLVVKGDIEQLRCSRTPRNLGLRGR